jgi:hypothetical protein
LEIVLDGGNVVGWGHRAIVTDKVFTRPWGWYWTRITVGYRAILTDNVFLEIPGMLRKVESNVLRDDPGLTELVVVPQEAHDPIGQSRRAKIWGTLGIISTLGP